MVTQTRRPRMAREERERRVLDAASELFYARGVHEVGMDELIGATGLGKATVYRLFPSKDALIAAVLQRRSDRILALVDADVADHPPAEAIRAIFAAVGEDLARPGFRGCAFHNASVEFADPGHPARVVARDYRAGLRDRLSALGEAHAPGAGLGDQLALVLDGMYVSAGHLGPDGPAASAPALVDRLLGRG